LKEVDGLPVPVRETCEKDSIQPSGDAYRIAYRKGEGGAERIWVIGTGPRGCLYGVGYLLTHLNWVLPAQLLVEDDFYTSPHSPIRGHQLGYRHTANSWDAWAPEQFEQYIRELAIFGTNAIENIPFQDERPCPHFKIPREEMNKHLSEICQKYGLDYWLWTPAEFDLKDQDQRKALLDKHEALYRSVPKLDGVFFPGGDPGDNPPDLVLLYLRDVAGLLSKYHPQAGVWLSMQGFTPRQVDWVYRFLEREKPTWLRGLVGGPSSPSIIETRKRLPAQYQLRDYPDITHTVRCQYPVPWWDTAYCLTLGRECVNARPLFYSRLIRHLSPFTDGFITYSDGVHDDVNKVIWSQLGWDPNKPVREILKDYARFFYISFYSEQIADGLLALEKNWEGSLADNGAVDATYAYWEQLDRTMPKDPNNWRHQMFMLRANYDYYTRHRLILETDLENQACEILRNAQQLGSDQAIAQATSILAQVDRARPLPEIRKKLDEVAEQLFNLISLQTSVPKYQASGAERGAVMDFVDRPINNRWWLEDEFKNISNYPTEPEKIARLLVLGSWGYPGPGSFYDDVGNPAQSEHVILGEGANTDPTLERSALPTFMWWEDGMSRRRLSFPSYMDWPLGMRYEGLDPKGTYLLRMTGQGEAKPRIDGNPVKSTTYSTQIGEFKEFPVPHKALQDGVIVVTWDKLREAHLNWRHQSHLAEVWLLRQ
jgi:hypothetical protein